MVCISDIREYWYDDGLGSDDRGAIAFHVLWGLEHVREFDRPRLDSKRPPPYQIAPDRPELNNSRISVCKVGLSSDFR